jgi:hypothetical protein
VLCLLTAALACDLTYIKEIVDTQKSDNKSTSLKGTFSRKRNYGLGNGSGSHTNLYARC